MDVPQGRFRLRRLPRRRRESLRAWDAADEYLLRHLAGQMSEDPVEGSGGRMLILNDSFGALAVALHSFSPVCQSDSFITQQAIRLNLTDNGLPAGSLPLIDSLEPLEGRFDRVVLRIPKTLALLEHQLISLRGHVDADTRIVAAGMVKSMTESAWKLMQRILGPTRPSRTERKARLIHVEVDESLPEPIDPYPVRYRLEGTDFTLINHANVFSRDSLDIGTRFFLGHLPRLTDVRDIIDLGCGNGVLGLVAAERNPAARLHFIDESAMAVASARETFRSAFGDGREASFCWADALTGLPEASADLVLCNPPFHQQQVVGKQIALRMFDQAGKVLRPGGELWVIGNGHLRYGQDLKRRFSHVVQVAANAKFAIHRALL